MTVPVNAIPSQQRRVSGTRLREGQEEMNGFMRNFAKDRLASGQSTRKVEELDEKIASVGVDQGSRGAHHAPEVTNANDALRADFREKRGL